ncbi:MAG TPA: LuxR C-terminal-related transcriptional regulator [Devosiaceae bacterium]
MYTLGDFITELRAAKTAEDAARSLISFFKSEGANNVHTFFGTDLVEQFVSTYPEWWPESTHERELALKHHVVRHSQISDEPLYFGVDICPQNPRATPEGLQLVRESFAEFGVRSGVLFPVHDALSGGPRGGVTVGFADHSDSFLKKMKESRDLLLLAAQAAHAQMLRLRGSEGRPDTFLTPREREVLILLAAGMRISQISDKIGIAEVTVNLHVQKARRKLDANTPAQAVARAIAWGWIDP